MKLGPERQNQGEDMRKELEVAETAAEKDLGGGVSGGWVPEHTERRPPGERKSGKGGQVTARYAFIESSLVRHHIPLDLM